MAQTWRLTRHLLQAQAQYHKFDKDFDVGKLQHNNVKLLHSGMQKVLLSLSYEQNRQTKCFKHHIRFGISSA